MKRVELVLFLLFFFMVLSINVIAQSGVGSTNIMSGLSPENVWNYFYEISQIPRCSGEEDKIIDWVIKTTKNLGLNPVVDEAGNIMIEKAASSGYENHEGVILQAHMDMVCNPIDMTFPLQLKIADGWLSANNTTLGADDGIGLSYALAVLNDNSIKHPPLEILLTVGEEDGLVGANKLKSNFIKYKKLINLDSEEEGVITIGCAGGGDSFITMPLERNPVTSGLTSIVISINGLQGGHSGIDIDKRANPNKLMAELLFVANKNLPDLKLISIKSGSRDNVIPDRTDAWLQIGENSLTKLDALKTSMLSKWKKEYGSIEPNINVDIYKTDNYDPIRKDISTNIISMLYELPYGVIAWSKELENTIETSVNISPINTYPNALKLTMMTRSAKLVERDKLRDQIKEIASKYGATCVNNEGYAPWEPNFNSPLLAFASQVYASMFGKNPEIKVTHGGLETAVIGSIKPGIDMIAIGPTLSNGHSPNEKVNIQSVDNVYKYLFELLKAL
jgi:dipeptidase D